ncbi:hypothetical protein ACERYU_001780 [Escherichia coli]|uniref:hypothetical protein n=1 Tax=Escherichia coli TaxID=562 RepID=UPI000A2E456B|nr:hypothetical protein [Escherichia coli]EEV0906304.1 hypothetical protein [Escherichia coli]EEW7663708.1 hypothetical protein [Escherichia coli]EFA0720997.1 hypothetical protein [Escherichia coli]EFK5491733.1 hypothetical protein [Escherichia coli]EFM3637897.1 hypothetical protein [Escherichia coli]
MTNNESSNKLINNVDKFKKAFSELSTLIDLAISMQDTILKQRNEIRRITFTLATVIYAALMMLFVIKVYATDIIHFDKFLQVSIFTFAFIAGISTFLLYRIKTILSEMKIERAAMQELMEVIFNLRKIIPKYSIDVVEMTILDLKLKRLRFY